MGMTVERLAALVSGQWDGRGERAITGAAGVLDAGSADVTFVADEANAKKLPRCQAGAVMLSQKLASGVQAVAQPFAVIIVEDPLAAMVLVLEQLRPRRPKRAIGVSPAAHIAASAKIGERVNIHPGAVIDDDVVIGDDCDIHAGVAIGPGCRLGNHVTLHPHVTLYADVVIGDRVIVHAQAVLGADGFGYRTRNGRHERIPHYGIVRVESDVEIGAGTTIDRAMIGETVIGEGTKLDNLVMIAHNCRLGKHNLFAGHVGLAGSVTTGDYVVCAGQVGIGDHVEIGAGAVLGAKAGVHGDLPGNATYLGAPAVPIADARRALMAWQKAPEMRQKIRDLEARVNELTRQSKPIGGDAASDRAAA